MGSKTDLQLHSPKCLFIAVRFMHFKIEGLKKVEAWRRWIDISEFIGGIREVSKNS